MPMSPQRDARSIRTEEKLLSRRWFRPTHIDVEFDPKGVVETRIYGRQIKQDGSLGLGILDHRWRRT